MRRLGILALIAAGCSGPPQALHWETTSLPSVEVLPGSERLLCYYLPADGQQRFLSQVEITLSEGTHHLIVLRIDERKLDGALLPAGPVDCADGEAPPAALDGMMPAAQQLHSVFTMPDGVAMGMERYHGLQFRAHYINATLQPLETHVTWRAGYVEPSAVRETAGMLFYVNADLDIPPGPGSASRSCTTPADIKMVSATGHMHMHGMTFDALVGGANVYHTETWDQPGIVTFAGAGLPVAAGTEIAWTCTYDNTTGAPLIFGPSASANEMCSLVAVYYPAPGGVTLGCQ